MRRPMIAHDSEIHKRDERYFGALLALQLPTATNDNNRSSPTNAFYGPFRGDETDASLA